ncbi:MAG: CDP-alcohol phosphatidyltransferase family protein [Bacteroidia bacterium]|nr:CDP-alcohol phosphatidyltransferase family protein [Bacteroidia bacterium]
MANVLTGMVMMPFIIMGNVQMALLLLSFALLFDFLDGFLARLLDATTELGKNLDSLADMVSFGASSGLILAYLISESMGITFPPKDFSQPFWIIGLLVPMFAAIRLAKFNVEEQSQHFSGVPTPANAILIFSLWFLYENGKRLDDSIWLKLQEMGILPAFWIGLSLISCVLMVVPIRLMALKFKGFSWGANRFRYVLIVLSGIFLLLFQSLALPFIFLLYLAMSFLSNSFKAEKSA